MTRLFPAAIVLAILAAGCEDANVLPPTPPVAEATVTETFTGTVNVLNVSSHNFFVGTTGKLVITLSSVRPTADPETASNVAVGLGVGVPAGFSCALTLGSDASKTVQASSSAQIRGTAISGTFCVTIYDVGNLTDSVDYTIIVAHS
jgi:hypothetical protein